MTWIKKNKKNYQYKKQNKNYQYKKNKKKTTSIKKQNKNYQYKKQKQKNQNGFWRADPFFSQGVFHKIEIRALKRKIEIFFG